MKISPDNLALTQSELLLITGALNDTAETDPFDQLVQEYLTGAHVAVRVAFASRIRYTDGAEPDNDELASILAHSGEIFMVIPDDFMIGSIRAALERIKETTDRDAASSEEKLSQVDDMLRTVAATEQHFGLGVVD